MDKKKSEEKLQDFCMDQILHLQVSKQYRFSILLSVGELDDYFWVLFPGEVIWLERESLNKFLNGSK